MKLTIQPDPQKAKSLLEMAHLTIERLKETDQKKYPSNTLTDYYDSIHKIIESICFSTGIKIKGDGAHQELIDYVCKTYNLNEADRVFLQEMRDYRNRISYEGFSISYNFVANNLARIEALIPKLISFIKL